MTKTPRFRRPAALTAGFGVVLAAPMIGLVLTLPVPASGPASADCALGFIDNPATPGECVPIPGEGQERSATDTVTPGDRVGDTANGSDLAACDLTQPYQDTVCPGPPQAPNTTANPDGTTNVTAPPPGDAPNSANGSDTAACDLNQPYGSPLCPGAPPP